ncbi:response regulator transcription factor [Salsipaludibacter albus]|uniref:response regulator transcription factor n=1 Tax=Salsipaludibacter albus TaxID=2849650 RepID=UPI001EE3D3A2|nr:response regulator transcription factor [Salsipaludibacter albus]MBY5163123.1 response regulator transcription factor [Salsipaludibacter albus]
MAHVLLVEDDARIRSSLVRALTDRGHAVLAEAAGMPALERAIDDPPEVVVLDLGLPDVDGERWLAMFRGLSDAPVVVATARDGEEEIVRILDAGADDYLVKPFSAAQLDARIRAVLRRVGTASTRPGPIDVGGLHIDPRGRVATLDGDELDLTRLEFDLLAHLAGRAGEVVSRRELLTEVWQQPLGGADKTVDVHLSWLRRKLGETAAEPRYLHTVRGVGVKLVAPTED